MVSNEYFRTFTVSGRTDAGKHRPVNKDGFVITSILCNQQQTIEDDTPDDESILLIVADGAAGTDAGIRACELIRANLLEQLQADWRIVNSSIEQLRIVIERINAQLHALLPDNLNLYFNTTTTAVLIEGEIASIAQVGDTRAYLLRGAQLVQVTIDQILIEQMFERESLEKFLTGEQKIDYLYAGIVLQSLGVLPHIKVGFTQVRLKRHDRLLLCTDGLWQKVSDHDIREILINNFNVAEACEELIEQALYRGGEDNVAVVVAEAIGEDLPERAESESPNQMFTILSELKNVRGILQALGLIKGEG